MPEERDAEVYAAVASAWPFYSVHHPLTDVYRQLD